MALGVASSKCKKCQKIRMPSAEKSCPEMQALPGWQLRSAGKEPAVDALRDGCQAAGCPLAAQARAAQREQPCESVSHFVRLLFEWLTPSAASSFVDF